MAERLEFMSKPENRGKKHGVIAPRGNAKTTIAANAYPVYATCEELEKYGILASETIGQSQKFLDVLKKELTENLLIKRDYPHAFGEGNVWNKTEIVTRNGIRWEAAGVRKSIRGTKEGSSRPTFILGDDLDDLECKYSATRRTKNWEWVTDTLLPIGEEGKTNFWFSGTAIHAECVVNRLPKQAGIACPMFSSITSWPKEKDGLWKDWEEVLNDPSEFDPDIRADNALQFFRDNQEAMLEDFEVLWTELEGPYELMVQRAQMGHRTFESEKQGNAVDPATCDWGNEPFEDAFFDDWPKPEDTLCKVMALDPSKGRLDKPSDWQAIAYLVVRVDGALFFDLELMRGTINEMCTRFVQGISQFNPDAAVVEADAFQELLLPVIEQIGKDQGLICGVGGISHQNKRKEIRIRRLGAWIERGRIFFKRRSKGAALCVEQLSQHPTGEYDDGPDAAEMCLRQATMLVNESKGASRPNNPY